MKSTHPASLGLASAMLLGLVAALGACEKKEEPKPTTTAPTGTGAAATEPKKEEEVKIDRALLVQFGKLPDQFASSDNPITKEKVELGRTLFFDPRISKNQDVSCNTCHDLAKSGVDGLATSEGHRKQHGKRNSPTVYNAAGQFVQFWDGRSKNVEEQALGPMLNPVEMAMPDGGTVMKVLTSMPKYVEAFKAAFPADKNPATFENFGKAIGAFERTLVLPSKFDQYLAGDDDALSNPEKAGLKKFMDLTCSSCHAGPLLGGMEYQKLGKVKPWEKTNDLGRYDVTKQESDKLMFKTPGLRNVAKTAPYYHDGSVATLEEAVKLMGTHQVGMALSDQDTKSIVTFLKTLTGEPKPAMMAKPELPPSTPKTPKPDPR